MEGSNKRYREAGLITRQKEPKNLEAPFDRIDSYLTPTELFYIRSHFPRPSLDRASYELRIDGAVRRPLALSYEQLRNMRSETRVATLECAGNSRVFLVPQVGSGSRSTQRRAPSSRPDLVRLEPAPSQGNSAGSPDRVRDEWS